MASVLIVDDEVGLRGMLEVVLRRDGHEVLGVGSGQDALRHLEAHPAVDVVVTDLRMDGVDGMQVLEACRRDHPQALVIVMTAYAQWDTAMRAMRQGAFNFITKPFDNQAMRNLVARAAAAREHMLASNERGEKSSLVHMIGQSAAMMRVQDLIRRVSPTDATVLITGESGTGKELVANAVHYDSLRSDKPFVRVNAGALTPSLLESELFGHRKGAFTGAIEDRPGLFTLAHGGTLFLDEIADVSTETQVKLLRVLETGEFMPLGGHEAATCDVRVVAATNRDLKAMVKAGSFRDDLYYRLAVIAVPMPALRERREDIPLLAGHLLSRHAVRLRRGVGGFTQKAMDACMTYSWPGNIRELDNRIQRGVALTAGGDIDVEPLFGDLGETPTGMWRAISGLATAAAKRASPALEPHQAPARGTALEARDACGRITAGEAVDLEETLRTIERDIIAAALATQDGNLTEAAKRLKINFRQMRYRVKQLGIR